MLVHHIISHHAKAAVIMVWGLCLLQGWGGEAGASASPYVNSTMMTIHHDPQKLNRGGTYGLGDLALSYPHFPTANPWASIVGRRWSPRIKILCCPSLCDPGSTYIYQNVETRARNRCDENTHVGGQSTYTNATGVPANSRQ